MYRLHATADSAGTIVHLALAEMGVPFEVCIPDRENGALDSAAYRRISPFGKMPALETPDGPMFETGAILLWLAERHGLAPAPLSPQRAAFLKWFIFTANTLHPGAMDLIYPDRPGGAACAPAVLAAAYARQRSHLGTLEGMLAADRPEWLSATAPTILSIYLAVLMRWTAVFTASAGTNIPASDFPHLQAIAVALETRPALIAAAAAEGLSGTFLSLPQG